MKLIYNKKASDYSKIKRLAERIDKEIEKFFKVKISGIKVIICMSKEEFERNKKMKTGSENVGFAIGKTVGIYHPRVLKKIFKRKDFETLLCHEITHVYSQNLIKNSFLIPMWLREGLSGYLAKQRATGLGKNKYNILEDYSFNIGNKFHSVSFSFTRFLIDKKKVDLIKIIKELGKIKNMKRYTSNKTKYLKFLNELFLKISRDSLKNLSQLWNKKRLK